MRAKHVRRFILLAARNRCSVVGGAPNQEHQLLAIFRKHAKQIEDISPVVGCDVSFGGPPD
jgi:hypothetical protein